MHITSTKLAPKHPRGVRSGEGPTEAVMGVILAAPELTFKPNGQDGKRIGRVAEGMYVFPANAEPSDPLGREIASIAKLLSVQFGSSLHPHLGTGVKAGWIVVGALSLLKRAQTGTVPWHEIALEGGGLAVEAFAAANAALAEQTQLSTDWAEGASLLLEVTKQSRGEGDANQFVMDKVLNQSLPMECTRKLLSLAIAAHETSPKFSYVAAHPIDVQID